MGHRLLFPKLNTCTRAGLFFMTLKVILSYTVFAQDIPYLDTILTVAACCLLGAAILRRTHTLQTLLLCAMFCLFSLYSVFRSGNISILITVITVLAVRNGKDCIRCLYCDTCLILALVLLCSLVGLIFGYEITVSTDGRTVFTGGLSHPNVLACLLFNLSLLWSWTNYARLNRRHLLLLLLYHLLVFLLTGTRTALFMGLFSTALLYVSKIGRKSVKAGLSLAAGCIFPAIALFIFLMMITYRSGWVLSGKVNTLLSGRIRLGAYAQAHYGWTFLGQSVGRKVVFGWDAGWGMREFTTFDCLYSAFMVNYGTAWLLLISLAFFMLARRQDNRVNCMLICWAIYAIAEGYTMNCYMCFPILLTTLLLSRQDGEVQL